MKYAREVIELMAAHPGRPFRIAEVRRYIESFEVGPVGKQRREAIRRGSIRVVESLIECGAVRTTPVARQVRYVWKSVT